MDNLPLKLAKGRRMKMKHRKADLKKLSLEAAYCVAVSSHRLGVKIGREGGLGE